MKSVAILAIVGVAVAAAFVLRSARTETSQAAARTSASAASVAARGVPTFVELGSDRCTSCRAMIPVLDALKTDDGCGLNVRFVDVWADREAGERFGVQVIPTQVLLDADGNEITRHTGFWSADAIRSAFASNGHPLARCVP